MNQNQTTQLPDACTQFTWCEGHESEPRHGAGLVDDSYHQAVLAEADATHFRVIAWKGEDSTDVLISIEMSDEWSISAADVDRELVDLRTAVDEAEKAIREFQRTNVAS